MEDKTREQAIEERDFKAESTELVDQARGMKVISGEDFAAAGAWLRDAIVPMRKKIEGTFDPIIAKAHEAHKTAISKKKELLAPIEQAETIVKRAMADYHLQQERERRRLEEEARAQANRISEELALEKALDAERRGDTAGAERAIESRPAVVVEVEKAPQAPVVSGISSRRTFRFEIVDPSKITAEFLVPDLAAIGKVVRAMGLQAEKMVGGIRVIEDASIAVGSRQ